MLCNKGIMLLVMKKKAVSELGKWAIQIGSNFFVRELSEFTILMRLMSL